MNRHLPDLEEADELLREWAWYFRDRRSFDRCKSIESRYKRASEDGDPDGWGDMDSAPKTAPARSYSVLRAMKTQDVLINCTTLIQRWAITYSFAYPGLPRFVVLKCMRKWTGRRLNWQSYLDQLDIGRCRVHTTLFSSYRLTA